METFITSDLHFFHKNIIEYCKRPFVSVDEMNSTLIKNWNNAVTKNDKIFILGDMFFKVSKEVILSIMQGLNGQKVLILGNHDNHSLEFYREVGFINVYYYPILYTNSCIFSHYPLEDTKGFINIHGHIHEKVIGDRFHINVCVEQTNYTPINIKTLKGIQS